MTTHAEQLAIEHDRIERDDAKARSYAREAPIGGGWLREPYPAHEGAGCGAGDHQGTPSWLMSLLALEFRFTSDLFANHANAVADHYYTEDRSAALELEHDDSELRNGGLRIFANPPYSRGNIIRSVRLVEQLADYGHQIVTLTRLDPGTEWFKVLRRRASSIRLLDDRIRFRGQRDVYNAPVCVSVWQPRWIWSGQDAAVTFWDAHAVWHGLQASEVRQLPLRTNTED